MSLLILAIAPVIVIIFYVYIKDEFEKEPKKLLLYTFLIGAIVSVFISAILYSISNYLLPKHKNLVFLINF